jgi:serine/threonine-protein kinase HipA
MAMAVGGEHDWERIEHKHWLVEARKSRLQHQLPGIIGELVERTPQVIESVRAQLPPGFTVAEPILQGLQAAAQRLSL